MKIKDVTNYLEQRFPIDLAYDFDKDRIGLVIGSFDIELKNVLLTLDLTMEVVNEAINKNCNLIISHHPYLFDPLYRIHFDTIKGKVIRKMFEHNISLYAMHTNLDCGEGGVNDTLAKLLSIKDIKVINNEIKQGNLLRYGEIAPTTVKDYSEYIKKTFNLKGIRVVGEENKIIKTVGVIGGSGAHPSEINDAIRLGLDAYVTGEVHLNNAIDAFDHNLVIFEVNHGVEKFVMYPLKEDLEKDLSLENKVFVSNINTDPLISY